MKVTILKKDGSQPDIDIHNVTSMSIDTHGALEGRLVVNSIRGCEKFQRHEWHKMVIVKDFAEEKV